jgi:hypothetical protein
VVGCPVLTVTIVIQLALVLLLVLLLSVLAQEGSAARAK